MANINNLRGWGRSPASYDRERLERMEENRQKKLKKKEQVENGEVSFSKQEGKDYFVELCAAEETINFLKAKLAAKEKEFNEFRERQRDPFARSYEMLRNLRNEELFATID